MVIFKQFYSKPASVQNSLLTSNNLKTNEFWQQSSTIILERKKSERQKSYFGCVW